MFARFLENEKTATENPPKTKHKISDFCIGDVWWCYFPWADKKELKDLHPAVILDHGISGTQLLSLRTTHYKNRQSFNEKYEVPGEH